MNETRKKLWDLIEACETAVLITQGTEGFAHARTMERIKVNHQAEEIWLATEAKERKLAEIAREPRATVYYSHPDKSWACVYGIAEAVTEQSLKSRFWKDDWEKYWPEGPLSENYVLIRIVPVQAEYLLLKNYERARAMFKNGAL
jgi:general stress protein 26